AAHQVLGLQLGHEEARLLPDGAEAQALADLVADEAAELAAQHHAPEATPGQGATELAAAQAPQRVRFAPEGEHRAGAHDDAAVGASRLARLQRLDAGCMRLRGADARRIQHAHVHAVPGGALVELREHRAFRLRPRDHEDAANLQRNAAFRAVRAQLPVALDAEARLRRAGLD